MTTLNDCIEVRKRLGVNIVFDNGKPRILEGL
jgi:hypothetical protein